MSGPRFDRIVPLVTLVLVGLGVVFLLELSPERLIVNLGEPLPSFSVAWALMGVLALVTGIGVELVARSQPKLSRSGWTTNVSLGRRRVELAFPLWSMPMLTLIAVFAFFRLFRGTLATNAYLLVLVATGILLLAVLTAQHYLIEGSRSRQQTARTALNMIAYALAFAIFSAVTFNRYRTLYAVALVFPSAMLLAADLLRGRIAGLWTTACVIALVVIESYWTLNYWPVPFWFNSVALLVLFYVLVGLVQATSEMRASMPDTAEGGLSRRALLEYGLVGSGALIALAIAAIWIRAQNIDLRGP